MIHNSSLGMPSTNRAAVGLAEAGTFVDAAVCSLDERVHQLADAFADLGRRLGDGDARLGALLEPLGGLTVRLVTAPRMEKCRHKSFIGGSGRDASTLFA